MARPGRYPGCSVALQASASLSPRELPQVEEGEFMPRLHRTEARPTNRRTLLDRIVRLRRADAARLDAGHVDEQDDETPSLVQLNDRIDHLEAVVEDLQDSLHRRSVRHDEDIDDLRRTTKPGAIAQALAQDARARGL
jgi:hypothetical protein